MNNEIFMMMAPAADASTAYKTLGQTRSTDAGDHQLAWTKLIDSSSYNGPDADLAFMNARLGVTEALTQAEDLEKRGQVGLNCVSASEQTSATCQAIAASLI